MEQLKAEYSRTSRRERKLQILSLTPRHFSIKKTMEFFCASEHMVKMSRKLKKENGILPEVPLLSKGRKISEEEQFSVKRFYKSNEIS